MRVLIFVDDVLNATFGVPLELSVQHLAAGDSVDLVVCRGALFACPSNSRHDGLACRLCRSRLDSALSAPALSGVRVHEVTFSEEDLKFDEPVFSTVDDLKKFEVDGVNLGFGAASSVVTVLIDPRPDLRKERELVSNNLRTSVGLYRWFKRHLPMFRPDRIYLFNGRRSSQMPLVRLAQEAGIEFVTYEMGHSSDKYILVRGTYFHDLERKKKDMVALWERAASEPQRREELAVRFYNDRRYGSGRNFPEAKFKEHQAKGLLPPDFSREERNIVIFNSSEFEFIAVEGYDNPVYKNQMVGLEAIINDPRLDPDIRLWLRVHPHLAGLKNSQTEAIARLDRSRVRVIGAEERIDTYALMEAAEKVVTFGSTVSIEAAFAGVPSILIGRDVYEYGGSCYTPSTHDEVIALLNDRNLKPLPKVGAQMFGHFMIARDIEYRHYDPINQEIVGHPARPSALVALAARVRWYHPLRRLRYWISRKVKRYLPDSMVALATRVLQSNER